MPAKTYYEAHITMVGKLSSIQPIVETLGWKFSSIDGDPTLGDGIKCYATRHFKASKNREEVLNELHRIANALSIFGCDVIRRKIELVIYDDRSSTVRFTCDGLCPECHLDELAPSTHREGNHVTILVGNEPLVADFVPSHESKSSGIPIIPDSRHCSSVGRAHA